MLSRYLRKNKRGISILISSVLVISLVIITSIMVYFFSQRQSSESIKYSEKIYLQSQVCQGVDYDIDSVCYLTDTNKENNKIKFSITNNGNEKLNGDFLLVQILSKGKLVDVVPTPPFTNIGLFEKVNSEVYYQSKPDSIRVIPRIIKEQNPIFCANDIRSFMVKTC